jgi:D-tyrosyl-tRNA(Tyr) deacylase
MKALLQRVSEASVSMDGNLFSRIGRGLLVFLGVEKGDTDQDLDYLLKKISNLRIFQDDQGKMNRSIQEVHGEVLLISQFTLAADCRKGNRPSFDHAEEPARAKHVYLRCIEKLRQNGVKVSTGDFGAYMQVHLINDGPVTILLSSRKERGQS